MMHIVYFSQKNQIFTEIESFDGEKIFVAPSPAKADGLRSRLKSASNQEVLTIAKFTSNLMNLLWDEYERPVIKRKSELLLIFGILKNKYLPDLGYEQFYQAYNLFSDLRSFTLDSEAVMEVLEDHPKVIKDAILLFWRLLEVTGYCDEHEAYQKISQKLRSLDKDNEIKKNYIFWGFQHLNGQQVDLIKTLSKNCDVIIPFPLSLKGKIRKNDWIGWLQEDETKELMLQAENSYPIGNLISINSREISLHLKEIIKDDDQIVIGVSKLSPSHLDIIPDTGINFKIPHQILKHELKEVAAQIKDFSGTHLDLIFFCENNLKTSKNFKLFKGWQLYLEALQSISDLTDEIIRVDTFFLKLLASVVSLNQPRTSFVPTTSHKAKIDLKDMSSLEDLDRNRRIIFCIDDRFEDIIGLGQNYTENIQKTLSAIGPIKRNELDLCFKEWEFRDIFSSANVLVLMNEGTLKHSLIWKRMFSGVELNKIEKTNLVQGKRIEDFLKQEPLKKFEGSLSATKIQNFIDCPRKFYFSNVDSILPVLKLEKDFGPLISGTIVHEIIQEYFNEKRSTNELDSLVEQMMQKYIVKENLSLPKDVYEKRRIIFSQRALNGIEFILNLENILKEKIEWKIEESFKITEPALLRGRIDCLGVSQNYLFLLDFKSSEYAASSTTEINDFEAVQLWIYAFASERLVENFKDKDIVIGYVVLDDPSKSNILSYDEKILEEVKASGICRGFKFKEDFSTKMSEAKYKINQIVENIQKETDFLPIPRKKVTCDYCDLNKLCVKSEIKNV